MTEFFEIGEFPNKSLDLVVPFAVITLPRRFPMKYSQFFPDTHGALAIFLELRRTSFSTWYGWIWLGHPATPLLAADFVELWTRRESIEVDVQTADLLERKVEENGPSAANPFDPGTTNEETPHLLVSDEEIVRMDPVGSPDTVPL